MKVCFIVDENKLAVCFLLNKANTRITTIELIRKRIKLYEVN